MTTTAAFDFAAAVTSMAASITDAVKANQKLVRVFTEHAAKAREAGQSTVQIVELLSCARRESLTQVDAYIKYCAARGEDSADIRRAFTNASAYAARVVGEKVLDIKIVWDRSNDCYKIQEKPAAGEKGKASASTKGQPKNDAAAQSAAIIEAATMPSTADHMRTISLEVAMAALIEVHGLEKVQAEYLKQAQALAVATAAEKATADDLAPRAPAIEKKSAAAMAELANKAPRKVQRKRKVA